LVGHSPVIATDVSEVWRKLQVRRLHNDRRVVGANLKAAKIVTELLVLFTVVPQLIDEHFYNEHQRLWGGDYMNYYRKRAGEIQIPQDFARFLPLESYIGLASRPRGGIVSGVLTVKIEDVVAAKDYVASLTDDQARRLHSSRLGSSSEAA